jgi:GNAT superfamily N-acetyltransferase
MLEAQTSFSLEDAETFLNSLHEFYAAHQDWNDVEKYWDNLQITWKDQQSEKFSSLFERISLSHQLAIEECERYTIFISTQIELASKQKNLLQRLGNSFQTIQSVNSSAKSGEVISQYNLNKSITDLQNQKKIDLQKSISSYNEESNYSSQLNDDLIYIRDVPDTGNMLNAWISLDGRIKIQDINVGKDSQRKGIGRKILETLENQLPESTTMYFTENLAPEFWEACGFIPHEIQNGVIEYRKKSSKRGL